MIAHLAGSILISGLLLLSQTETDIDISYPQWFLNQGQIACDKAVVGFATPSRFYPDSAAGRANINAYEHFARQTMTNIAGRAVYWHTSDGMRWLENDLNESFDSTLIVIAEHILTPVDTFFSESMIITLSTSPEIEISSELTQFSSLETSSPSWITSLPQDSLYNYALGSAPLYYHELNSWKRAERNARLKMARNQYVHVNSTNNSTDKTSHTIHEQEFAARLVNYSVHARWLDIKERVCYVLIRVKK